MINRSKQDEMTTQNDKTKTINYFNCLSSHLLLRNHSNDIRTHIEWHCFCFDCIHFFILVYLFALLCFIRIFCRLLVIRPVSYFNWMCETIDNEKPCKSRCEQQQQQQQQKNDGKLNKPKKRRENENNNHKRETRTQISVFT